MIARAGSLLLVFALLGNVVLADEVDDGIAGLEKALKEKTKADIQHFVKLLGEKYGAAKAEQQVKIAKLVGTALNQPDQDTKDMAVESLSKMDAKASEALIKEIDKKTTEDNTNYFGACVRALGKTKDPKAGLEKLKKLLNYKTNEGQAAAADALGNYKELDLEGKKVIVDLLLKMWGSAHSKAQAPRDTTAKKKLDTIKGPIEESIKALTGQTQSGFESWQKWWNDTGKKATKW